MRSTRGTSLAGFTRSLWPMRQARPAGRRRRRAARPLAVQQLEPKIALAVDSGLLPPTPTLVADINQMPVGAGPRNLTIAGDLGYFAVRDPAGPSGSFGVELSLWKTDGTSEGTVRVGSNDLSLGSSQPSMATIGSTLFFVGSDGTSGFGLWKTDGTESGTVRISPEGLSLAYSSFGPVAPFELKAVGSTLFFVARDEDSGQELWKTDGTPEGTVQVSDLRPGEYDSRPADLTATDSTLYFVANDGTSGRQLWKTDGTNDGTVRLTDLPDVDYEYTNARGLTAVGSTLYFTADDGTSGRELWKTNGSLQGTVLVKDLFAGSSGSNPLSLTAVGSTLFFIANDSIDEFALWKTNGTAEGTVRVTAPDLSLGEEWPAFDSTVFIPNEMVAFGDATLFFVADDGTPGKAIWKTDGTAQGTVLVADVVAAEDGVSPARLTPVNDELFFFADGNKLWKTNGTSAGTSQVATIGDENSEGSGSYGAMAVLNGSLLFAADDGERGNELWVADIATGQASLLSDIDTSNRGSFSSYGSASESVIIGSVLYFAADDGVSARALWRTDGTEQGTVRISDFAGNYGGVGNVTALGASLYFTIDNFSGESPATELWKTDGTAQSTVRVTRFSGLGLYGVRNFTPAGSLLYFTADTEAGEELWKSDGTALGTVLVKDISAGASSSEPRNLTVVGSTLFFVADDGVSGHELWKTDGTEPGTVLVKDINEGYSSWPQSLTAIGSTLYFTASDAVSGRELWKTDGTESGTVLVKDIDEGSPNSWPQDLTVVGSTLYFTAADGVSGTELWKTDGTPNGTVRVRDIHDGSFGSFPTALTAFGSSLYFSADDGVAGRELWKTDGTEAGTVLVADLAPGIYYQGVQGEVPAGSYLHGFTPVGSVLFFANGSSLWKTNGTEAGTVQVSDDSLTVNRLIGAAGMTLYMVADDGATGLELWRYTENDAPTGVALTPPSGSITENTSTVSRIKVAGIAITDDGLGTNSITLSGPDAASFEVVGLELFLKAGVLIDFETKSAYAVTVSVADASVTGSSPVTAGFTLTVTDVPEPAVISLPSPFANTVTEDAGVDPSGFLVTGGTFRITDPDAGQAAFKTTVGVPAGVTNLGALTISAGGAFTYRVLNSLDAVQALRAGQTRSDVFTIESLDGTKLDVTFSIVGVVDVLSGVVADGYLAGATVFADTNGNRVLDAGELRTTTDNAGNFSFDFGSLTATLISIGGTDISTGLPFKGSLTAPAGSTVINPLTTVVTAAVEASLGAAAPADAAALATAVAAATSKVVAGLGLPSVNLTTFDPLAPTADQTVALAVQKVAAAVANVMVVANTVGADVGAVVRNVATAVTAAPSSTAVNLADASVLTQILTAPGASGGGSAAPPAAAVVALTQSNSQISSAGNLGAIAQLQTSVQSAGGFVDENAVASTIVYQATAPAGMSGPAFSLKEVAGDDRAILSIDASTGAVRLLSPANYEAKGAYRFTVVASQQGQATVETVVSVRVNDLNEAPTGLALAVTSVAENQPAGTVIGALSASDPDAGDTLTYALVSGDGSGDNGAFTIDGTQLKAASTFNFEVRNSYSVRIRVSDAKGLVTEVPVTISVMDVADEPLVVERVTAPAPAIFGAGQRVQFAVTLSEIVQVRGKPQIQVRAGGATRTATYVSGSGSATLTFQYVVGKADVADVVSIGQKFVFAKKSAIVAGAEKLAAALPAGIAGLVADGVRIDAVPGSVIGKVRVPVGGTYRVGDSLDFIVRFSEAVIVSGAPQIGLTGLTSPRQATYVSGTGSTELTFRYVVRSGDAIRGKKGLGLAKSISLPGGASIGDEAGNRAVLKVIAPSLKTIRLDAAASATEMAAPNKRSRAVAFATLG